VQKISVIDLYLPSCGNENLEKSAFIIKCANVRALFAENSALCTCGTTMMRTPRLRQFALGHFPLATIT